MVNPDIIGSNAVTPTCIYNRIKKIRPWSENSDWKHLKASHWVTFKRLQNNVDCDFLKTAVTFSKQYLYKLISHQHPDIFCNSIKLRHDCVIKQYFAPISLCQQAVERMWMILHYKIQQLRKMDLITVILLCVTTGVRCCIGKQWTCNCTDKWRSTQHMCIEYVSVSIHACQWACTYRCVQ